MKLSECKEIAKTKYFSLCNLYNFANILYIHYLKAYRYITVAVKPKVRPKNT